VHLLDLRQALPLPRGQVIQFFMQMPDLKQVSGRPLPSTDLPPGNLSVRVIRGSLANNIAGAKVELTVDGKPQTLTTDASGRVQLSGLKPGAHVKARTTVDGESLESEDITIAASGIRVMLVATDPDAAKRAAEDQRLAKGPAAKGTVVFGPESRIIMEMREDRLTAYYLFDIQNSSRTPVDIGGPLQLDLPREARGASALQGSTKQATIGGTHVTVLGPFAPGSTPLQIAFELPYAGAVARVDQRMPAALPQVIVIVAQLGGLDLQSKQITQKREVTDQGDRIIAGTGPAIPAGQTLSFEVSGLPHHPLWPRYLALTLAGAVVTVGITAAIKGRPRRREA
jgi:hypothetical protein